MQLLTVTDENLPEYVETLTHWLRDYEELMYWYAHPLDQGCRVPPSVFTDQHYRSMLKHIVADGQRGLLLIVSEDTVVGFVEIKHRVHNQLHISTLYLSYDSRGLGLTGKVFDMLKQNYHVDILTVSTTAGNTHADHVYRKYGFAPCKTTYIC